MNKLVFGAFYTENTPYERVFHEILLPSCDKLGIQPIVVEMPNHGSWIRNVAEKPHAILKLLMEHIVNGECLVFLDVDASIEEYPYLLEMIPSEYEMGFHTLNWNTWYGHTAAQPTLELLTGTMFFRNGPNMKGLCNEWYNIAQSTLQWEQKVLQGIMPRYPQVKVYDLPIEYCYMATLPDGRAPLVKCTPVIKHYQKSREYKREIR